MNKRSLLKGETSKDIGLALFTIKYYWRLAQIPMNGISNNLVIK